MTRRSAGLSAVEDAVANDVTLPTVCLALGIEHSLTRPCRPHTNGKAARFIQSALREWACGWIGQNSGQRTQALAHWQRHHNGHRPHGGIGGVPTLQMTPAASICRTESAA